MTNNKKAPLAEVPTQMVAQEEKTVTVDKSEPEFDIDGFLDKRKQFITKVNNIMVKGSDYHEIQNRKSLAKGGAEKIASIFGWTATFERDAEVIESFADIKGLIALVCNLTKADQIVGQGRGAASLAKNAGDPNKTIKMAQKSAFIDAVLRASGLSDFFTQDLEDMRQEDIGRPQQTYQKPPSYTPAKPYKTYGEGQGNTNYTGSAGLTQLSITDKAYMTLAKQLEACETKEEYDQISSDIRMAKENGKITQADYSSLIKVAVKTVERITQN